MGLPTLGQVQSINPNGNISSNATDNSNDAANTLVLSSHVIIRDGDFSVLPSSCLCIDAPHALPSPLRVKKLTVNFCDLFGRDFGSAVVCEQAVDLLLYVC